jgi:aldehyde dehydrogenase (NAD+)
MMETWHPLGVVGVISAFNFPVAVWSWNFALAIVCGDAVLWKPSEKTPLTALACQALFERALKRFGDAPDHLLQLLQLLQGRREVGEALVDHPKVALLSATGSTRMGREVGPRVARRFGRSLLELGGNNAVIVTPTADLDLAVRGILFAAVGSDCGIANVNIGTSGAEIGGAFGGEKETGGGRESGSDAWRAYMRRATNTVNYSRQLPLAQGVRFDV